MENKNYFGNGIPVEDVIVPFAPFIALGEEVAITNYNGKFVAEFTISSAPSRTIFGNGWGKNGHVIQPPHWVVIQVTTTEDANIQISASHKEQNWDDINYEPINGFFQNSYWVEVADNATIVGDGSIIKIKAQDLSCILNSAWAYGKQISWCQAEREWQPVCK